jgi:hypothetical protein
VKITLEVGVSKKKKAPENRMLLRLSYHGLGIPEASLRDTALTLQTLSDFL